MPTAPAPANALTGARLRALIAHLVDETGIPLGQGDTTHPAARYDVDQVILDEYRIPLLPTTRPGRYRLITGVYITLDEGGWRRLITEDGRDTVLLDEVIQTIATAPLAAGAGDVDRVMCPRQLAESEHSERKARLLDQREL